MLSQWILYYIILSTKTPTTLSKRMHFAFSFLLLDLVTYDRYRIDTFSPDTDDISLCWNCLFPSLLSYLVPETQMKQTHNEHWENAAYKKIHNTNSCHYTPTIFSSFHHISSVSNICRFLILILTKTVTNRRYYILIFV